MKSPKLKVPKMEVDFFDNLPPEITVKILSRLPLRAITRCKCVRKSWRDLIGTSELAKIAKTAPGVVITSGRSKHVEVYEFADEIEMEPEGHQLRYIPVIEFADIDFFNKSELHGSADGLLFLGPVTTINFKPSGLYICNPVTREFMSLPDYPNHDVVYSTPAVMNSGFGVSKSEKFKVVWVVHECVRDPHTHDVLRITSSVCHIYTLGTREWRSIADCAPLANDYYKLGAFINGRVHWLVTDFQGSNLISCFDLDKETFSTFSTPTPLSGTETCLGGLVSLGDCLCMFDNSTCDSDIVIWLMKEDGDEKTWTKDFVIRAYSDCREIVYPIKFFRDGDILMVFSGLPMFYYFKETKSMTEIDELGVCKDGGGCEATFHRLSYISLESGFPTEIVNKF